MAMVIIRVRVTAASPITIHTIALPRLTVASLRVRNKIERPKIAIGTFVFSLVSLNDQFTCVQGQ